MRYAKYFFSHAVSLAGSPGYDTTNQPRPSCDYLEDYITDYPLREIVLYNQDIRNFANTHSVFHNEITSLKDYTRNVLASEISGTDKNHFIFYATSYVRLVYNCATI